MSADGEGRLSDEHILALVLGDEDDLAAAEAAAAPGSVRRRAGQYTELVHLLVAQDPDDAVRFDGFPTPFGTMHVATTGVGLARVSWHAGSDAAFARQLESRFPDRPVVRDPHALAEARAQMERYFRAELDRFELPVDLGDLPPFQRSVLEAVRTVPFGHVVRYADLARSIRRPTAARAVGNALGANPVAIVVPCHRVIRGDGTLGGYGGGVEYKERLLALEGRGDLLRAG